MSAGSVQAPRASTVAPSLVPTPHEGASSTQPGALAWGRRRTRSGLRARSRPASAPAHYPDNTDLLAGLVLRKPAAWKQFLERFGPAVERIVARALGVDSDHADVIQEVFVQVLERIHQLRDPPALKSWITTVAVFTARGHIRRRRHGRWLRFSAPADLPELTIHPPSDDDRALVRSTYRVLDGLPPPERIAFSLRFIGGMELNEVAAACDVSLATVKRRLGRAEARFLEGGWGDPALTERIARGDRWDARQAA